MPKIQTIRGDIQPQELGLTVSHEHLYTDLRGPHVPGYAQTDPDKVAQTLKPYLAEIERLGVTGFIEYSTIGVGRNPAILQKLGETTPIHIVVPTGAYREAYVPAELLPKSVAELTELWVNEIQTGIDNTDIKAGFIKMAVSDEGITPIEAKNLKAAVQTSRATGAVIASHTIGGELANAEIQLLEQYGHDLERFIWTHAQSEDEDHYRLAAAQKGIYISIDAIGSGWVPDEVMLAQTITLIEAGHADRILLSHDAGWYDPSQPDGQPQPDGIRGYTALFQDFIPALKARGIRSEIIHQITVTNPAQAFTIA